MKKSIGILRARKFVESMMASLPDDKQHRLPPVTQLAAQAGVSDSTMYKAVRLLKKEGKILGVPGQRAMTAPAKGSAQDILANMRIVEQADSQNLRWQRLAERIKRDILNGIYLPGKQIPSNKLLQLRYGVSYPSLKKALDYLAAETIVENYGRWYRVAPVAAKSHSSVKIVLVAGFDKVRKTPFIPQEFLRTAETECSLNKIDLQIVMYAHENDTPVYLDADTRRPCRLPEHESIAGYLFPIISPFQNYEGVLLDTISAGKPVAIFDELGNTLNDPRIGRHKLVRHFISQSGREAGIQCGRFLRARGHKNIAFFSPFHNEMFSRNRLEGILQNYEQGSSCNCYEFTINKFVREYKARSGRDTAMKIINEAYDGYTRKPPSLVYFRESAILTRDRYISSLAVYFAALLPLLQSALANRSITAWVAPMDIVAGLLMDFLLCNDVRIPRDISVFSFDDDVFALTNRVTSYNFNIGAVARAMIAYVMEGSLGALFKKSLPIVIDGMIVERATTGKAGRQSTND